MYIFRNSHAVAQYKEEEVNQVVWVMITTHFPWESWTWHSTKLAALKQSNDYEPVFISSNHNGM
jgi:hypothetical protein